LVMVALGLVTWLAGTSLRRLVLGCFGAALGMPASFFLGTHSPAVAGVAAGGGAACGALVPRVFLAVWLAVFGMAVAFAVLARAHLLAGQGTLFGRPDAAQTDGYTIPQSLDAVRAYSIDAGDRVRAAGRTLTPIRWAIIGALGGGLLLLGLFFERVAAAVACSMLGTTLIFGGLVLLLIFKGSAPVEHIERQGTPYGLVLAGMAVFGTVEQLLVCRLPPRASGGRSGKSHSKPEGSKHGWRSR
jgi:hypothetical protein